MSYGFAGHIGVAKEVTWGTAVAATDYIESFSESIASVIERFETRNIIGVFTQPDDIGGARRHQGDWVFHGHPVSMGYALDGVFGINSVSVVLSGFLHLNEFTPLQSDQNSLHPLPPYTMEIFRAGTVVTTSFQYAGCQFGGIAMNVVPNQDLRCTVNVIGKTRNMIAKSTPSFPGSPVHPFTFDTCSVQLDSAAITRVEALTITYQNNLEGILTLNAANEIQKVRRSTSPLITVGGTMDFESLADFNTFAAQTEQTLKVSFTKANSFALVIDMPRVVFTEYPVVIPGRERLTVDWSMKGFYNAGSANAMKVSLTSVNCF